MFPILHPEIISDVIQSLRGHMCPPVWYSPYFHYRLSNTKGKGQLLFIMMLVLWFFLV